MFEVLQELAKQWGLDPKIFTPASFATYVFGLITAGAGIAAKSWLKQYRARPNLSVSLETAIYSVSWDADKVEAALETGKDHFLSCLSRDNSTVYQTRLEYRGGTRPVPVEVPYLPYQQADKRSTEEYRGEVRAYIDTFRESFPNFHDNHYALVGGAANFVVTNNSSRAIDDVDIEITLDGIRAVGKPSKGRGDSLKDVMQSSLPTLREWGPKLVNPIRPVNMRQAATAVPDITYPPGYNVPSFRNKDNSVYIRFMIPRLMPNESVNTAEFFHLDGFVFIANETTQKQPMGRGRAGAKGFNKSVKIKVPFEVSEPIDLTKNTIELISGTL